MYSCTACTSCTALAEIFTFHKFQTEMGLNPSSVSQKTISSEDFINNVVSAGAENARLNPDLFNHN